MISWILQEKRILKKNKKTLPYVYLLNILQGERAERFKDLTQQEGKVSQQPWAEKQACLKKIAVEEGVVQYCQVMYEIFRQKANEIRVRLEQMAEIPS